MQEKYYTLVRIGIANYYREVTMQEKHYTLVRVGIVNGQPTWVTSDFPEFSNIQDSDVVTECFDCQLVILRDKSGNVIGFSVADIIPKENQ